MMLAPHWISLGRQSRLNKSRETSIKKLHRLQIEISPSSEGVRQDTRFEGFSKDIFSPIIIQKYFAT